jgi:hypothetical protein
LHAMGEFEDHIKCLRIAIIVLPTLLVLLVPSSINRRKTTANIEILTKLQP